MRMHMRGRARAYVQYAGKHFQLDASVERAPRAPEGLGAGATFALGLAARYFNLRYRLPGADDSNN